MWTSAFVLASKPSSCSCVAVGSVICLNVLRPYPSNFLERPLCNRHGDLALAACQLRAIYICRLRQYWRTIALRLYSESVLPLPLGCGIAQSIYRPTIIRHQPYQTPYRKCRIGCKTSENRCTSGVQHEMAAASRKARIEEANRDA
jgi:hypothetical protein